MEKQPYLIRSKAEEAKILDAQSQKMKNDPSFAREVLQKAGILGADGKLTADYKRTS